MIGSVGCGAEVFNGKRADTFTQQWNCWPRVALMLSPVKLCKYPLEQYREALIEGSSKKTFRAAKVSLALNSSSQSHAVTPILGSPGPPIWI